MKFSQLAWDKISNVYQQILDHPFNQELINGMLERQKFYYYIQQDLIFLENLSKSLSIAASKAENYSHLKFLVNISLESLKSADHILRPFLPNDYAHNKLSYTCFSYVNYLLNLAIFEPLEIYLSAILPCYKIYHEIGRYIFTNSVDTNPYADWISHYSQENLSQSLLVLTEMLDSFASSTNKVSQSRMLDEFYNSSVLEWHFWNDAYHLRDLDKLLN